MVDGVSKKLGIATVIDEDIDGADGYYDPKTKELHISLNSESPIRDVIKHEITHVLEGNKEYRALVDFMKESLSSEWNAKRKAIKDKYDRINKYNKEHNLELIDDSDIIIDNETMAELMEERESLDSYIEKVATEKPGLINTVRKFVQEVKAKLGKFLPKKELSKWEQAEAKWKNALDYAVKNGTMNTEGNIEYAIYDEFKTNSMQWAYHPETKPGDVKIFNRRGREFVLLEATNDGFVELKVGNYKEVRTKYERACRDANDEIYGNLESFESDRRRNNWDRVHDRGRRERRGNDGRYIRQDERKGLQTDTAGSNEYLRNSDKREPVNTSVPEGAKPKLKDTLKNGGYGKIEEDDIPYNEKRQLEDYIIRKNNRGDKIKTVDCKEIGNNFYIWKNKSKTDFDVMGMLPLEGNEEIINLYRKGVENGTYRKAEDIRRMLDELDDGYGNDDRGSVVGKDGQTNIDDGEVFEVESKGNRRGVVRGSFEDIEGRKYKLKDVSDIVDEHSKYEDQADFEDASRFEEEWKGKVKEYGAIPKGEKPIRNIEVPKKISKKKVVSRFARTLLEAGITPEENVSDFEKMILAGEMTHEVIADKNVQEDVTKHNLKFYSVMFIFLLIFVEIRI